MKMKAYQISLEPDKEIPQFKVLSVAETDVDLRTVLKTGVHPAGLTVNIHGRDTSNLPDRIIREINEDPIMVPELKQLGYCHEMSMPRHSYYYNEAPLKIVFRNIAEHIYFVDGLRYVELLRIAKEQLRKRWSDNIARKILMATGGSFNDIRRFLKNKNKTMKMSSYADLENYDLGKILSLDDFAHFEKTLISHGLPRTNFRALKFAEKITSSSNQSLISFVPAIHDFQALWRSECSEPYSQYTNIMYNCKRNGDAITFVPDLDRRPEKREQAKRIAQSWGTGAGKYCFTVKIADIEKMIEEHLCKLSFPYLNYVADTTPEESRGEIVEKHVQRYFIGKHITANLSNDSFKDILREHNIPMTGRKDELLKKLYDLLANLYSKKELEYAEYFSTNRFIRIKTTVGSFSERFHVDDESMVNNTLLAMYVLKHLRGNSILEASHENNTFELKDLAKSLLNTEVNVTGHFLKVE
jgi:hypothetical protein